MSIDRARAALHGQPTDRIPLFDMPNHPGFVQKLTGLDPNADAVDAISTAIEKLDVDMMMGSVPRAVGFATGWRNQENCRKDIFGYDPSRDRDDIAGMDPEAAYRQAQGEIDLDTADGRGVALPIGRTFTTCLHYAAEDLDWEEFLMACLTDEEKVSALLDTFQACSEKILAAWMRTTCEVMLTHDDIAMNTGTVQSPDWLREHVISRYPAIFGHVHRRGIPHIFMTDGDFSAVAKDLAEAGAGGFFIDAPCVDLAWLASEVGTDKIFFTGPAPSTVRVGSPAQIREEMKQLADVARDLPKFFFHMPGGWYPDMPTENVQAYYDAVTDFGVR